VVAVSLRTEADVEETWANVDAIGVRTGFSPSTPLEIGIPIFAQWFLGYRANA